MKTIRDMKSTTNMRNGHGRDVDATPEIQSLMYRVELNSFVLNILEMRQSRRTDPHQNKFVQKLIHIHPNQYQ
jgi:hypothetical protein